MVEGLASRILFTAWPPTMTRLRFAPLECLEQRDNPAASFTELPVLPTWHEGTVANVNRLAILGQFDGLNRNVFMKVGDSNTFSSDFLSALGSPTFNNITSGLVSFGSQVADTLAAYRTSINGSTQNSLTRNGSAVYPGWQTPSMAAGIPAEVNAIRPAVALVLAGTNDATVERSPAQFREYLSNLIDSLTDRHVIPILSTIPRLMRFGSDRENLSLQYNQVIADLAAEKQIPLLNLWRGIEGLPLSGIKSLFESAPGFTNPDLIHLSVSPNGGGSFSPLDLLYGQNLRNLLTLEALGQLRSRVFSAPQPMPQTQDWRSMADISQPLVTGNNTGQPAYFQVRDAQTGQVVGSRLAYEPTFRGGVKASLGDMTGDGIPDVITGPGPGGGPIIKVFSGADGSEVMTFAAYEPSFRGGVNVAVGDVDGDGSPEIIVGAGVGGAPRVRVFRADGSLISDFFAFESSLRGGVEVAVANGAVVAGAGQGGGPVVKLFDGVTGELRYAQTVFDGSLRGGVTVSAGDLDGDGSEELVVGAGPGGGPIVRILNGSTGEVIRDFAVGDSSNRQGIKVAVLPAYGDTAARIAVSTQQRAPRLFSTDGQDLGIDLGTGLNGAFVDG